VITAQTLARNLAITAQALAQILAITAHTLVRILVVLTTPTTAIVIMRSLTMATIARDHAKYADWTAASASRS